jgi:hypothetical protein
MQELKLALFELVLPNTGVELVLQQAGSSAAVLHLPQVGWCLLLEHVLHVQPHWSWASLQHLQQSLGNHECCTSFRYHT